PRDLAHRRRMVALAHHPLLRGRGARRRETRDPLSGPGLRGLVDPTALTAASARLHRAALSLRVFIPGWSVVSRRAGARGDAPGLSGHGPHRSPWPLRIHGLRPSLQAP